MVNDILTAVLLLFFLLAGNGAYGDETSLHEGLNAGAAYSTLGRISAGGGANFTMPGFSDNGLFAQHSSLNLSLGSLPDFTKPDLDRGSLWLLETTDLRALGIERNRYSGTAFGANLAGVALPFRLGGTSGARHWEILRLGGDVVYRNMNTDFGARHTGNAGGGVVRAHLDEQFRILDGVQLRAFQEIVYTAMAGAVADRTGAAFLQDLKFSAGLGVYVDIGAEPSVRRIPRTNVVTGERSEVVSDNPGKRLRLLVLNVEGESHPVGNILPFSKAATLKTGLEYAF